MRRTLVLVFAVVSLLAPARVSAAARPAPVLSISCTPQARAGMANCAVSGRGFASHQELIIAYAVAEAGSKRPRTYGRRQQADAHGAFSRQPIRLRFIAHYVLTVTVLDAKRRPLITLDVYGQTRQTLVWQCGARENAHGTVPCRLTGRGFKPGQVLHITYGWSTGTEGQGWNHTDLRRQAKVDRHGMFSRRAISVPDPSCYTFQILVTSRTTNASFQLAGITILVGRPDPSGRCG